MKKFLVSILAIIYLAASTGAAVQLHYCMSQPAQLQFSSNNSALCHLCGMTKKASKGCCHDEQKIIKIEKDQKQADAYFQYIKAPVAVLENRLSIYPPAHLYHAAAANPCSNAPPRSGKTSVNIYNCVFRI